MRLDDLGVVGRPLPPHPDEGQSRAIRLVRLSESGLMVADPVEDIVKSTVVTRDGESCGIVEDLLLVFELRRVLFMHVRLSDRRAGTWRRVLVPVEAIRRICPGAVHIEHSAERLRHAPSCDYRAPFAEWSERQYRYFGYPPVLPEASEQSDWAHFGDSPYWSASRCYSPHLCPSNTDQRAF